MQGASAGLAVLHLCLWITELIDHLGPVLPVFLVIAAFQVIPIVVICVPYIVYLLQLFVSIAGLMMLLSFFFFFLFSFFFFAMSFDQ